MKRKAAFYLSVGVAALVAVAIAMRVTAIRNLVFGAPASA